MAMISRSVATSIDIDYDLRMIVAHWKRGAELNNGHSQATSLAFLQPRTGCGKPSELWRMVLPRSVRLHQLRFFWLT